MKGARWIGAAVLAAVLGPLPAWAAPGRVVTLPVEVDGQLGSQWKLQLEEGIAEGLGRGQFDVVVSEVGCPDHACWSGIASTHTARFVVRTVVSADDRNYEVTISLLDPRSGETVAQATESCQLCGMLEVRGVVTDQAAVLRAKLDGLATEPPVVVVRSVPSEAVVFIDGEPVGATPVRREVTAGEHVVRAQKHGHASSERQFEAVAGVEETLTLTLEPLPDLAPRVRPWGYVGLGLGGASLATGVTLLVLDERPAPGDRCTGANVDAQGTCRYRWNTLTPGLVFTVSGAVVVLASTALLIAMRSRGASRRAARSTWHPTGRGWAVRF